MAQDRKEFLDALNERGVQCGDHIVENLARDYDKVAAAAILARDYDKVATAVIVQLLEHMAANAGVTPLTREAVYAVQAGVLDGAGMIQEANPWGGWTIERKD